MNPVEDVNHKKKGVKKMNPMALMKIKGMLETFSKNHPKVPMFFQSAGQCMEVGTVIEINVTTADGKNLCTNMRVTQDDLDLIEQLKQLS